MLSEKMIRPGRLRQTVGAPYRPPRRLGPIPQGNRQKRRTLYPLRPKFVAVLAALSILTVAACDKRQRDDSNTHFFSAHTSLRVQLDRIERDLWTDSRDPASGRSDDERRALDSVCRRFARWCGPTEAAKARAARSLVSFIFDTLGIRFDTARSCVETMLPAPVAKEKRGSCLGISALMLIIAEGCGMPLHGVLVPGHFFVRFDNGKVRMNIETMKAGRAMPDEWYAERFGVPNPRGRYLANLTKEQTAAVVRYNIGNVFLARNDFSASLRYYQTALSALPGFADARGNYAIALAGQGRLDSAIAVLSGLKAAYPDCKAVDATLGTLWLRKDDPEAALRHFGLALEREPRDAVALFGAGVSCIRLHRLAEAERFLRQAIAARPEYPEARQALDRILRAKGRKE